MNFSTTLDQAANDLGAARGELGTTQADLGRTQADLGKANADLAERHKQLQQFARDLADVNGQLKERQADLARLAGMRAGAELEIHVREIRTQLDYFLITKGDRRYLKAIESLQKDTEDRLHEAERWSSTPRELELTAKARAGFRRLTTVLASLADTAGMTRWPPPVPGIIDNVLVEEIRQRASDLSMDPCKDQLARAKAQGHWKTLQDKMGRVRSPRVRMSYDVEGNRRRIRWNSRSSSACSPTCPASRPARGTATRSPLPPDRPGQLRSNDGTLRAARGTAAA